MRLPFKGISNFSKVLIIAVFAIAAALFDFKYFLDLHSRAEAYDELHSRINFINVSTTKLEYLVDAYMVTHQYEGYPIGLILENIKELDDNLGGIIESPKYLSVWSTDMVISDGLKAAGTDWTGIRNELQRLSQKISDDELALLHNSIDMNIVLMTEKTERLLAAVSGKRTGVQSDIKKLTVWNMLGFVFSVAALCFIYYRTVTRPVAKAVDTARRRLSGSSGAQFREAGALAPLASELNALMESSREAVTDAASERSRLESGIKRASVQFDSLASIMFCASRTLSQNEVLKYALRETMGSTSADAGAVFMIEGDELRLKSSAGLDGNYRENNHGTAGWSAAFDGAAVFHEACRAPSALSELAARNGMSLAASAPLIYDKKNAGLLALFYKDGQAFRECDLKFLSAASATISVATGHSGLIQNEMSARRFYERLLNQMPWGLAIFALDGRCVLMNGLARHMLGADPESDPSFYSVFEDDLLISQGIMASIRKSCEGYSAEFIVNYSPLSTRALGLTGNPRKLRVKSMPLYAAGGDVANIVLMYEDLTETLQAGGRPL